MGNWKYPCRTINPGNLGETWEVGIAAEQYRAIINHGHDKAQARIILVHEVLEHPVAIRKGWNRAGKREGLFLVYIGKPKEDYHKISPTICVPAPPGMVFVVFVDPDGTIEEWTWRKHADGDISTPDGVNGELVWQLNQS